MRTLATAVIAANSRELPCAVKATDCKLGIAAAF
jgi:hypothetical protein